MHKQDFDFFKVFIVSTLAVIFCMFSFCRIEKLSSTKIAVTVDESIRSEAVSGRVIVLISKTESFRVNENGVPIFGVNADSLMPGENVIIDETTRGYPVENLKDIPAGEYFIQAYLNVYTTFHRSDGHVIKLHNDQGEGQRWRRSPGNLFSEPVKVEFDPKKGNTLNIVLNKVIPAISPPQDTEWVKNIRIRSELLSQFWGRDMYLGAKVLLPKGFNENPNTKYPVHYIQGHFSTRNPGNFETDSLFTQAWKSDDYPRMLLVTFQHANPYYDDSYGVNSENIGPYGDAITTELIPHVENRFRAIGLPYARALSGGSTGGWIALAMQVWYADYFGSTWSFYPDQVDFRKYQVINLLQDKNAYYTEHEWTRVARPGRRRTDGNIVYTMEQENLLEEVIGDRYRSGGQWAVWNAVFAPVDEDGYPKSLWDPITGEIDSVTANWAKEHYDIRHYLENNWATVGPKLVGKINVYCGRMDDYYLNEAVYLLEKFLESTETPYYDGKFEYGATGGHGWRPFDRTQLNRLIADHITKNAPAGTNTASWKY